MQYRFIHAIADISATQWDALNKTQEPFLQHGFLAALEASQSVGGNSGWQSMHLLIEEDATLIAALPLYLKTHSYGEYVFDWSWADAYQRHGFNYYPKLISAIPFTPATGPRLLSRDAVVPQLLACVAQALNEQCTAVKASGWHILFPAESALSNLKTLDGDLRLGCQYHWFNRSFSQFDDFLALFSSRKRKNLRKERQLVTSQGIHCERLVGEQILPEHLDFLFHCYQVTYAKLSGHGGYLREAFFQLLYPLREQILLVMAYRDGKPIACALNFFSADTLYGRYWGCIEEWDCLHFEACYYQGIEFCIEHGLEKFDPGAQGEHKIGRGFEPTLTYSLHHLCDAQFRHAVGNFLNEESQHILAYQQQARSKLPFKENSQES